MLVKEVVGEAGASCVPMHAGKYLLVAVGGSFIIRRSKLSAPAPDARVSRSRARVPPNLGWAETQTLEEVPRARLP